MHDKDDGPSDPAKVAATITAALAGDLIKLPGFTATATTGADGTATFPLPNPQPQPVTLYRAIDALGGVGNTSFHEGWNTAIGEALVILTERGFTEHADPIILPAFDVTKRKDLSGDASLAIEVLKLHQRGGPFTPSDAGKIAEVIGRLETVIRHEREHAGKCEAGRRVAEDKLATAEALARELSERVDAQPATHATRPEVEILLAEIEQHKSDVRSAEKAFEEEREKRERSDRLLGEQTVRMAELEMRLEGAAFALRHGMNEGVEASAAMFSPSTSLVDYLAAPLDGTKPKIPGRGLYGDETIVVGVNHLRESMRLLGRLSNDDRDDKLSAVVERLFMCAGLLPERHYKPRFRVVTSPRFYSDGEREKAARALFDQSPIGFTIAHERQRVDLVANALGMRRAAQ